MKPVMKSAMIAAALAMTSACGAQPQPLAATASVSETSLCQIDRPIAVAVAPAEGVDDPGNRFDTDATVGALFEHNARYAAACPAGG